MQPVPCCVLLILLFLGPRVTLIVLALAGDYVGSAFSSLLWPVLGFFFAPFFVLAYAWSVHTYGGVEGLGLLACIVAALLDLGVLGGAARGRPES